MAWSPLRFLEEAFVYSTSAAANLIEACKVSRDAGDSGDEYPGRKAGAIAPSVSCLYLISCALPAGLQPFMGFDFL